MVSTPRQILLEWSDQGKWDERGSDKHGERRDKNRKVFWWGNLEDRSHLEGLDADGGIILKLILMRWDWRSSTGIIWLGMGTN